MKHTEDLLKEACAQLAIEEAEEALRALDPQTLAQADALYLRHRKEIFALLGSKKKRHASWLRAAACLLLLLGGAWLMLTAPFSEPVPLAPVYTASVAPFYSAAPTFSPVPAQIPTRSPTFSPIPTPTKTISSTPSPSPVPTPSPIPTSAPTPPPTEAPVLSAVPPAWSGEYFPEIPSGYLLHSLDADENLLKAVYEKQDGSQIIFEEYAQTTILPIPASSQVSYVQINESVALQLASDGQITLCWEEDGRTLALTAPADRALALAKSVEKISEE